jgi:hypothetical protein
LAQNQKFGSKKNGNESRSHGAGLRTRWGVERYRPPVIRSSMSPMLQTNEPGIGGAGTQRERDLTSRPPASSCNKIVSRP